ncbi:MAG TPA: ArsR family transcriptional regulator, partial [Pseudomonas sp.]|nr:ArsR family transcriptional regulator [Pseudomonas sp.]
MNLRAQAIPEQREALAALCKASGDELRLNVLRALANDSFGVLELAQIFDIGQSGMSHHLKVLAQADLVATRREGNAIFYRRALPDSLRLGGRLHAALLDEVDDLALPAEVQGRIAQVQQRRAATSQDFFLRVEERFRAQQDLIAGLPQYRESLLALLDKLHFDPSASALEVGPGDGGFLPDLARRFAQVTALDNSPTMLELARQVCQREGLDNVNLQLADALGATDVVADCVVLNMVLHHFSDPALALCQLAKRVKAGGSLLITELCSHDQGWAREACGDLCLCFRRGGFARWANGAGLVRGGNRYVGPRTSVQIPV